MLIASDRHRADDLARWRVLEQTDALRAARISYLDKIDLAALEIADFARRGPCIVACSWGKDSTVLAHAAWLAQSRYGSAAPVVYLRLDPISNPDSLLVRDAFCASHPGLDYREGVSWCPEDRWRRDVLGYPLQDALRAAIGGHGDYWRTRHVSGIRAQESKLRRMTIGAKGAVTKSACAPLAKWDAADVYAALHALRLPVHPAYACSMGGIFDRDWLRVDTLGASRGEERGRGEWERAYYAAELRGIAAAYARDPGQESPAFLEATARGRT